MDRIFRRGYATSCVARRAHANISALMPDLVYEVTATDAGAVGYPGEETTAP